MQRRIYDRERFRIGERDKGKREEGKRQLEGANKRCLDVTSTHVSSTVTFRPT
jgi:hypothetical protein